MHQACCGPMFNGPYPYVLARTLAAAVFALVIVLMLAATVVPVAVAAIVISLG
jgi:hypothetical protein